MHRQKDTQHKTSLSLTAASWHTGGLETSLWMGQVCVLSGHWAVSNSHVLIARYLSPSMCRVWLFWVTSSTCIHLQFLLPLGLGHTCAITGEGIKVRIEVCHPFSHWFPASAFQLCLKFKTTFNWPKQWGAAKKTTGWLLIAYIYFWKHTHTHTNTIPKGENSCVIVSRAFNN